MEEDIKILVVDDHQVMREGLRCMLEVEEDFQVVGDVADAREVLTQVELLSPEIVLMDIKMPDVDGIQLTQQIKQKRPSCDVIMLTFYEEYLAQAIEAGATGYLLKDIKREELAKAIRATRQGRSILNLSLTQEHLADFATAAGEQQRTLLTQRELTILQLIASGTTTKEIASQLFFSESSVKRSILSIFEKLGARNRSEAVAEAYKRELI